VAYQLTPKRLAAARANLQKAWQANWLGPLNRAERPPNLRHGFFARDLRRSVILLGEDVTAYDAHVRRFQQGLTPRTERERRIVQRLAEAAWRLMRGYRARALAQERKLRREMDMVVDAAPLNDRETRALGYFLVQSFNDEAYLVACMQRLRNQFERLFRLLLIERTGSDMGLRYYSQAKFSKWDREVPFS
jgi:hypothetical protein